MASIPVGSLFYGSEQVTVNLPSNPGKGKKTPVKFSETLSPPVDATFGVAMLAGWSLSYDSGDHHVTEELVQIDPLPTDQIAYEVTGKVAFWDRKDDDPWSAAVWIEVLYFTDYWA